MMKKTMAFLLALALVFGIYAGGEENAPMLEVGKITPLTPDAAYDLDGNGEIDSVTLALFEDAEGMETFTLTVNDQTATDYGVFLNETLYGLRLNEYGGTLLMVSENGPSDDYQSYIYLYEDGALTFTGAIGALPEDMRATGGIITATVRANVLYTWFHEADFSLARGFTYNAEGDWVELGPVIYGIPRYSYPMGLIVNLMVDLPLYASPLDAQYALTIPADTRVVLAASDDVEWVYLETIDRAQGGWLRLSGDYGIDCLVNGTPMMGTEVFDGLWLAD